MDTQILLNQYFETAFSAPDRIKRLRELILSLAMQGKLVPQDSTDQPARELLQEIEAEKQRLIKAEKIKKQKPLEPIQLEEIPYELPESWEWVKIRNIC
ncbi:MAG: restriction endonuclease, partial [Microcystaceae cyanobacterium]